MGANRKPQNNKPSAIKGASIGQLTSNIKNKQTRSEVFTKLKHTKKVSNSEKELASAARSVRIDCVAYLRLPTLHW